MTDTRQRPKRLLALDILRGITIAGMILVNNPGSWGHIYGPLAHAQWNGLTPTDLVFPFFMFIMGVSTYMSLRKYDFRLSASAAWKILRRTVVIFLIGIGIAWFSLTLRRIAGGKPVVEAMLNFDHIRMLGVMPRLALCYGAGSLLALSMSRRALAWFVACLLAVYGAVLLLGNGLVFSADNIIAIVDRAVLGTDHMYSDTIDGVTLKFDPEGLLSTLPSIAHMLIGFLCGSLLMQTADNRERILRLFIVGTILSFAGFLLDYGMPINKKIWSPTFVLTTCGLASSFLALLIWIIDIRGHRRWCRFFEAFGVNPLFMYCLGAVLSIVMSFIRVPYAAAEAGVISLKGWLYKAVCMPAAAGDATLASFIFAVAFVLLNWCVGYILYKKKIYIKI
ncbi:MAG: DUF5009 domain-containing protein [Muribaculaceae bacterium]|nr:DUF5009 domain-containing protein [Muribaculaceae bacterium]